MFCFFFLRAFPLTSCSSRLIQSGCTPIINLNKSAPKPESTLSVIVNAKKLWCKPKYNIWSKKNCSLTLKIHTILH